MNLRRPDPEKLREARIIAKAVLGIAYPPPTPDPTLDAIVRRMK